METLSCTSIFFRIQIYLKYVFFLQAVGIFKKPRAKDLAMFLTGKLYINVGTSYRQVSALRGKIEHTEHDSTIDIRQHVNLNNNIKLLTSSMHAESYVLWILF
jgi:hypothetical protein